MGEVSRNKLPRYLPSVFLLDKELEFYTGLSSDKKSEILYKMGKNGKNQKVSGSYGMLLLLLLIRYYASKVDGTLNLKMSLPQQLFEEWIQSDKSRRTQHGKHGDLVFIRNSQECV